MSQYARSGQCLLMHLEVPASLVGLEHRWVPYGRVYLVGLVVPSVLVHQEDQHCLESPVGQPVLPKALSHLVHPSLLVPRCRPVDLVHLVVRHIQAFPVDQVDPAGQHSTCRTEGVAGNREGTVAGRMGVVKDTVTGTVVGTVVDHMDVVMDTVTNRVRCCIVRMY